MEIRDGVTAGTLPPEFYWNGCTVDEIIEHKTFQSARLFVISLFISKKSQMWTMVWLVEKIMIDPRITRGRPEWRRCSRRGSATSSTPDPIRPGRSATTGRPTDPSTAVARPQTAAPGRRWVDTRPESSTTSTVRQRPRPLPSVPAASGWRWPCCATAGGSADRRRRRRHDAPARPSASQCSSAPIEASRSWTASGSLRRSVDNWIVQRKSMGVSSIILWELVN